MLTALKDVFVYDKVAHGLLDQAHRCLRTLLQKIFDALKELHKLGVAHNNVHLPNVCFDSGFNAIMIDMKR